MKRLFVPLYLLLIAAGAYIVADTINLLIGSRLEASIEIPRAPIPKGVPRVLEASPDDLSKIIEGNIFNSKARGSKSVEMAPSEGALSLPRVPLAVLLVGTVVGPPSFAVLEDPKSHEQTLYRAGESVGAEARIVSILRNEIVVERGERGPQEKIVVNLFPGQGESPGASATPGAAPASTPSGVGSGIRQVTSDKWMVDRREIEAVVENMPQFLTKARLIPNFTDGKPDGFRIFAIDPGSVYSKIGLVNGDILQRINGVEIKDPANFARVFQQLKDEREITIDLVRNSKRETFTYEIR